MPETEIIVVDDQRLVEARISGLSRKQVAERFHVSASTVRAAERAFAADATDLETERAIIGEQLSRIIHTFYSKAREGDARAAELMIDLVRRRSELLGLDAPRTVRLEDQRPPEQRPSGTDLIEAALARVAAEHNAATAEMPAAADADNQLN